MFSLTKFSVLALAAFASSSLSSPLKPRMEEAGYSMLGYRSVNKHEADVINQNHELVFDPAFAKSQQLGIGKSLSGGAGEWDYALNNWYCFVMMQTSTLEGLHKCWIPADRNFSGEDIIASYVNSQYVSGKNKKKEEYKSYFDAKRTLRFGKVEDKSYNELLIPSWLVTSNEGNIKAQCYESVPKLKAGMEEEWGVAYTYVDYTTETFRNPKPEVPKPEV